jgi:hypothetical protein
MSFWSNVMRFCSIRYAVNPLPYFTTKIFSNKFSIVLGSILALSIPLLGLEPRIFEKAAV